MASLKPINRWGALAVLTAALTMLAPPAMATILVDSGLNGTSVGNLNPGGKAIAFTMGDTAFTLDSVQVRLRTGSGVPADDDMTFVALRVV